MVWATETEDAWPGRESGERPTPEELCERYAQRVYRFAVMVSRNHAEAEDLAQDALVRAITRLDQFDPRRGDIEAWLWQIVTNVARDAGRMARRRQALLERLLLQLPQSIPVETDVPDSIEDEDLVDAVRELDRRSRALIALRFGADLDYARVGSSLGMSPAAARMATRRALSALRRRLEAGGWTKP